MGGHAILTEAFGQEKPEGQGEEAVDPAAQNWPGTHGVTRDGEEQKLPRGQRAQVTLEVELQAEARPAAHPPQLVHAVALGADA